jgi:hypothetical protein
VPNGSGSLFISRGLQVERRRVVLWQDLGDGMQMPLSAFRTQRGIVAWTGERRSALGHRGLLRVRQAKQRAALRQTVRTFAVDQEAVAANTMKTGRQDMAEEAPDEFFGVKGHALVLAVTVVVIAEGDAAVVNPLDAVVGNGDAVDVAAEIGRNRGQGVTGRA